MGSRGTLLLHTELIINQTESSHIGSMHATLNTGPPPHFSTCKDGVLHLNARIQNVSLFKYILYLIIVYIFLIPPLSYDYFES